MNRAQVVIIGAGIVGCSAAYHLAQLGWTDVLVLDQGPLYETGGSTSHAPGGVFEINFSKTMTEFARYTVGLYAGLESSGMPAWYPVGSLEVAWTPERERDLKRKLGVARSWGIEAEIVSSRQSRDLIPLLSDRVLCALHVPTDGIARPIRAAEALARAAQQRGVRFEGGVAVRGFDIAENRVHGIETDHGRVEAETILIATGIWAPHTGRLAGIKIPLQPMQHQYVVTEPLPGLAGETIEVRHPVLRHQDRSMYFRQERDAYGIGSYRHAPMPFDAEQIPTAAAGVPPAIRQFIPEAFALPLDYARELIPALEKAPIARAINGMFSFTPDGMPILGESPEVQGLWVAAAVWITHAGGAGKSIAEWITGSEPEWDLRECDIARFHPHSLARSYVETRAAQQYREVYNIVHPRQQAPAPRNLRVSPFYPRQLELDAHFFESGGWERPHWYGANESAGPRFPRRTGWEAIEWSAAIGAEHLGTRERAGLFDMSTFTKIEVTGPDALNFLQVISANEINQPPGRVIYTAMLTASGGIRCDLTIMRTSIDRFVIMTAGATGAYDLAWIRRQACAWKHVRITDVTSAICCIGLWGPRSRDILRAVSDEDLSNEAFRYLQVRTIRVAEVPTMAARISYAGELGYELYAPSEFGLRLWDAIWEAGRACGVVAAGTGALDSLRLEKGYRVWGADIHSEYNPLEAGLEFALKLNKGSFLGRDALIRAKDRGITRKLCCVTLDDPDGLVEGKEPVFADGSKVGYVTSAGYGYSVERCIGLVYLPVRYSVPGTGVQIEYFGERLAATVQAAPLFDPHNTRLRG